MNDATRILNACGADPAASEDLLPLVYDELRKLAAARMAQEAPGQTLQATALVHEAWIRLLGPEAHTQSWGNRGHFFAAAAEAMRRILIDRARKRQRVRHGGGIGESRPGRYRCRGDGVSRRVARNGRGDRETGIRRPGGREAYQAAFLCRAGNDGDRLGDGDF